MICIEFLAKNTISKREFYLTEVISIALFVFLWHNLMPVSSCRAKKCIVRVFNALSAFVIRGVALE